MSSIRLELSKGHSRSASHGGTTIISPSYTGRPSALKKGHQRAFSQGQISDSESLLNRGHTRTPSKTDFILPEGHRESELSVFAFEKHKGHSRQASRTDSIYTLRNNTPPSFWKKHFLFFWKNKPTHAIEVLNYRTIIPNHILPPNSINTKRRRRNGGSCAGNKICTTKYTLLSFIPKNLLEQFHRVANLYFIFIVLLNWFPLINAFGKEIAVVPVLFVLGVTALKDLFEDRRRHASDKRINNSICKVYASEENCYKDVLWKNVKPGDLVYLSNNEVIPADILVLSCSDSHGLCYIDTCNLDGESNLKQRQVAPGFINKIRTFDPNLFRSVIEVESPTTKIYRFHGAIIHPSGGKVPVGTQNLLLRECVLKNTDFVEGIVIYSGHETKAMLNNNGPRYKRSSLERKVNADILWCVVILFILCFVGALGHTMWLSSFNIPIKQIPFIPYEYIPDFFFLLLFGTFIIIFQVMIPLSLYVTVELVKLLQVYHIHNNSKLIDSSTGKKVECRALNITEELGQVQYIFSDKTGTLTENKMLFRRCTIFGIDYNHPPPVLWSQDSTTEVPPLCLNPKLAQLNSTDIYSQFSSTRDPTVNNFLPPHPVTGNNFLPPHPPTSTSGGYVTFSKTSTNQSKRVQEFMLVLALCNTVVISSHSHQNELCPPSSDTDDSIDDKTVPITGSRYGLTVVDNLVAFKHLAHRNLIKKTPNLFKHLMPSTSASSKTQNLTNNVPLKSKKLKSLRIVKPIFEAESPDELALVETAYSYNCRLVQRTPSKATILTPGNRLMEFDVLKILPFDSSRKCMSVILRHPVTREIIVFCKGADSTIMPLLRPTDDFETQQIIFKTQQHLDAYARQGLRVLIIAKRVLSEREYNDWLKLHREAELTVNDRDRKISRSYYELERNFELLGATGIEDRLQEGVPETIATLRSAGIVIWVLTGDKKETAINVAYSSHLFSPQMEIIKISARSKDNAQNSILNHLKEIENRKDLELPEAVANSTTNIEKTRNCIYQFLSILSKQRLKLFSSNGNNNRKSSFRNKIQKPRALVIDGKTLTFILDRRSDLQEPFLRLTRYCTSVLCCRATPLQKAYIVRVVKDKLHMRTLAIGDGANDVSMIQAADVGIGISGQEGMQAVMASDFSMPRFKFLERFLLVHGHWSYDRLSNMIVYFFYKNAIFVFLIFWYQFYCGFSGSVMIDEMYLMLYNLFFTSLPPLVIGVYDQDAPEELLISNPILYNKGRHGLAYQSYSYWLSIIDALYQSLVIFYFTFWAYDNTEIGIWEFGMCTVTSCMLTMLLQGCLETRSWNIILAISFTISLGSFFIFTLFYNSICFQCHGFLANTWVLYNTLGTFTYWLIVLISTVCALLPRLIFVSLKVTFIPDDVSKKLIDAKRVSRQKENFLVSWSRSTSSSSIYKTSELLAKDSKYNNLTAVG